MKFLIDVCAGSCLANWLRDRGYMSCKFVTDSLPFFLRIPSLGAKNGNAGMGFMTPVVMVAA